MLCIEKVLLVVGGRFELPNPKERIYSPPRLATSLPHQVKICELILNLKFKTNYFRHALRVKKVLMTPTGFEPVIPP